MTITYARTGTSRRDPARAARTSGATASTGKRSTSTVGQEPTRRYTACEEGRGEGEVSGRKLASPAVKVARGPGSAARRPTRTGRARAGRAVRRSSPAPAASATRGSRSRRAASTPSDRRRAARLRDQQQRVATSVRRIQESCMRLPARGRAGRAVLGLARSGRAREPAWPRSKEIALQVQIVLVGAMSLHLLRGARSSCSSSWPAPAATARGSLLDRGVIETLRGQSRTICSTTAASTSCCRYRLAARGADRASPAPRCAGGHFLSSTSAPVRCATSAFGACRSRGSTGCCSPTSTPTTSATSARR